MDNLAVFSLLLLALPVNYPLLTQFGGFVSGANSSPTDESECVAPLESLFDCLEYAQGKEAVPPPSCCSNIDKVFHSQKKCLCELIAASFEQGKSGGGGNDVSNLLPPFNRTIAFHMPAVCNVPADPSLCPGLLGIPPSSPEAKEFESAIPKKNGTTVLSPDRSNTSTTPILTMKSNSPLSPITISFPLIALIGGFVILSQQ